jgi:hypothetical protein
MLACKNVIRNLQEFVWAISKNSDAMAEEKIKKNENKFHRHCQHSNIAVIIAQIDAFISF